MLLVIGVYTYKVLLLTLLVGIPNTIARHQKQHKLADKNDMKNYFKAHKRRNPCNLWLIYYTQAKEQRTK